MNSVEEFNAYRSRMNDRILSSDNLVIKRLFNLDTNCYEAGKVDEATKEMIGLACSMVLRCDDCVKYHLGQCKSLGITTSQIFEVFAIANLIGGTIVIPHLRRAVEYWDALQPESSIMEAEELEERWEKLLDKIAALVGKRPADLNAVLFLIGIQELGQGVRTFTKEQKQDLMHIAVCKLLSYDGIYELEGTDAQGWPHWKLVQKLPYVRLSEQENLLKMYAIEYFNQIN